MQVQLENLEVRLVPAVAKEKQEDAAAAMKSYVSIDKKRPLSVSLVPVPGLVHVATRELRKREEKPPAHTTTGGDVLAQLLRVSYKETPPRKGIGMGSPTPKKRPKFVDQTKERVSEVEMEKRDGREVREEPTDRTNDDPRETASLTSSCATVEVSEVEMEKRDGGEVGEELTDRTNDDPRETAASTSSCATVEVSEVEMETRDGGEVGEELTDRTNDDPRETAASTSSCAKVEVIDSEGEQEVKEIAKWWLLPEEDLQEHRKHTLDLFFCRINYEDVEKCFNAMDYLLSITGLAVVSTRADVWMLPALPPSLKVPMDCCLNITLSYAFFRL